ncbi:MAG: hypothetical protein IJ637_04160, partial [Prevotella sp.]|nr:hypothetical protein [Prevotella sp.]
KEALKDVIAQAKLRKATGKTAASFAALTSAISDAETALAAAESASALDGAKDALLAAIDGLKLQDGYTNLTAAMFKQYTSLETPGVGSAVSGNYHLFEASDIPYGDNNVSELKWADLGCYDKLIITTSGDVKPRLCMNRLVANGQQAEAQADSKMLDINPNNDYTWSTGKYQTIDGNVYTISLASIKDDYSFARLHCIKKQGWGAGAFVSDLLLYRTLSVGSNLYATFGCTDKAAKLNGVTAYAAKYAAGKLTLTEVTNVPAGKGVVAVAAAAGYYAPTFDVAADDIDTDLKVSDGNVAGDGSSIYVLAKGTSGVGFYLLKSGDKVPAGKVYLEVAGGAPEFIGFAGAETTGIKNVNAQQTNTVVYNLNGQRVNKAQKGINIVNGKKFIVR